MFLYPIYVGATGLGPLQQMHPGIVVGAVHRPELSWDVLQRAFRGPCVGAFPGKNDELRCVSGIRWMMSTPKHMRKIMEKKYGKKKIMEKTYIDIFFPLFSEAKSCSLWGTRDDNSRRRTTVTICCSWRPPSQVRLPWVIRLHRVGPGKASVFMGLDCYPLVN